MIRSSLYSSILLVVSTLLVPHACLAQAPGPQVVLLSSPSSGDCATAFFLDAARLVTNAHVASQLCRGTDCSGTEVYSPATKLELGRLTLSKNLGAFDIAVITAEFPLANVSPARFRSPILNEEVSSLGHPRCGPQQSSAGKILNIDSLHLLSSTKSMHGSSGSPVIAADGSVVGIIDEAASVYDGVKSLLAGSSFNSRGIRADIFTKLNFLEGLALLESSADELFSYYIADVVPQNNLRRLRASMQFIAMLDGFRETLVQNSETSSHVLRTLSALKSYPLAALNFPAKSTPSSFDSKVELLVVAANIELKGAKRDVLRRVNDNDVLQLTANNGRSPVQQQALLELFRQAVASGYQGLEVSIAGFISIVVVMGIGLFILWAFVFGYYLNAFRGPFILRFAKSLAVAITFPISIFFLNSVSRKAP